MFCSLKIYNKIYSKTKLHTMTLSLPPFWQCAHTQFNPVTSYATNDSHRLSRLTWSFACHGLFTKGSVLPSSLYCLSLPSFSSFSPPGSTPQQFPHWSLCIHWIQLCYYGNHNTLFSHSCKPDHQDPLVRLSLQLLSQAGVNPFSPFSIWAPVIARLSNHGLQASSISPT